MATKRRVRDGSKGRQLEIVDVHGQGCIYARPHRCIFDPCTCAVLQTKKIVEIGSGYSTRVTAAALIRNENDWGVISQFKVSDGLLQSAAHVFMICFTGFCLR